MPSYDIEVYELGEFRFEIHDEDKYWVQNGIAGFWATADELGNMHRVLDAFIKEGIVL